MKSTITKRTTILISLLFCYLMSGYAQTVVINELMSSNNSTILDDFGDADDWVEIYNASNTAVNIGGLYLTDDEALPTKWQIPTDFTSLTTIAVGGHLVIWLDAEPTEGTLHSTFKLSSSGEFLAIYANDGTTVIDSLTFGAIPTDVSFGRTPDAATTWTQMQPATPGTANEATATLVNKPEASIPAGHQPSSINVTLSCSTPDATIRYTIDGSIPTESDALYSGPIHFDTSSVLLARAFATDMTPSQVAMFTYFINETHTFPIVSIAVDPFDFFDPATGIYATETDVEVPAYVSMFEPDGTLAFTSEAVTEKQGTGSMVLPQKSLLFKSLSGGFNYPIFPTYNINAYDGFVSRNSGQDWNITMFRDAFITDLVRSTTDLDDLIREPHIHTQAFRPGILYLNGTYWGIHNIRERANKTYVSLHEGLADDEMVYMENILNVSPQWDYLMNYVDTAQMQANATYDRLREIVDMSEWIDYNIFEIYADNYDWPANNNRRWRALSGTDTLWHWIAFDFDLGFGMLLADGSWNSGNPYANSLYRALALNDNSVYPNPEWATRLLRKSMQNPVFRTRFLNRMADMLNTHLSSNRVNTRLDEFITTYTPEIQDHFDHWNFGLNIWDQNTTKLSNFATARPEILRTYVINYFDEVDATAQITLAAEPTQAGKIFLNTIRLRPENYPWTGTYFTGLDIPISAVALPGYVFSHWSDSTLGTKADTTYAITGDAQLTAYFVLGDTSTSCVTINEVYYNPAAPINTGEWVELHNPTTDTAHLDAWFIMDKGGNYFSFPEGTVIPPDSFLVVVEDSTSFRSIYPSTPFVVGNYGATPWSMKLDNNADEVRLYNAAAYMIDSLRYADTAPWPTGADGTGNSLQRYTYCDSTNYATNWFADVPTPGEANFIIIATNCLPNNSNFNVVPNPTYGQSQLLYMSPLAGTALINITNVTGVAISSERVQVNTGQNQHLIDATNLPAGAYIVSATIDGRKIGSKIFIKID